MNERVRKLRKELGLTMEKFGEAVGVKKGSINNIEKGTSNLTSQMITSICNVTWEGGRRVSEQWLREGVGDMFLAEPPDEFAKLAQAYQLAPGLDVVLRQLVQLPVEYQGAVVDFIRRCAAELEAVGGIQADQAAEAAADPAQDEAEETAEEFRERLHRELDEALDKREETEKSKVTVSG